MAKGLNAPVPSSSIVRLFDMRSAADAVAVAAIRPRPESPDSPPSPSASLTEFTRTETALPASPMPPPQRTASGSGFVKRELVLTPSADETLRRLIDLYRRATGARLSGSHVVRVILRAVAHAMPSLEHEAARLGPMKLPSNAKGQANERERFEARIADAFLAGLSGSENESMR